MLRTTLPVLALLALPGAALPFGAPTICQPFDIGNATSLPWEGDSFGRSPDYDVANTVRDTLAVLERSDDTLVHMETIRRAAIYVTGTEGRGAREDPRLEARVHELFSRLRKRILVQEVAPKANPRDLGLAWFDLGFALVAFEQAGSPLDDGSAAAFARAIEKRPDDGALRLGVALGSFGREGAPAERRRQFAEAARLANDPHGLLRKNVVACGRRFLDPRAYDELVARVGD